MSAVLDWLAGEQPEARERIANALTDTERAEFDYHWAFFARPDQLAPPGPWRIWLVLAGRGFGKTRAGAEWVRMIADGDGSARIALISASLSEARAVMVEGESGIIACCPPDRRPLFEPSLKRLRWPNGAMAHLFSAAEPEFLRGPQHSHACRPSAKGILRESGLCADRCAFAAERDCLDQCAADRSGQWRCVPGDCTGNSGMDR